MACFTKIFNRNKVFNPNESNGLTEKQQRNDKFASSSTSSALSSNSKKQNLNVETGRFIYLSEDSFTYSTSSNNNFESKNNNSSSSNTIASSKNTTTTVNRNGTDKKSSIQSDPVINHRDQLQLSPINKNQLNCSTTATTTNTTAEILPKSKLTNKNHINNSIHNYTNTNTNANENTRPAETTQLSNSLSSDSNNLVEKHQKHLNNLQNKQKQQKTNKKIKKENENLQQQQQLKAESKIVKNKMKNSSKTTEKVTKIKTSNESKRIKSSENSNSSSIKNEDNQQDGKKLKKEKRKINGKESAKTEKQSTNAEQKPMQIIEEQPMKIKQQQTMKSVHVDSERIEKNEIVTEIRNNEKPEPIAQLQQDRIDNIESSVKKTSIINDVEDKSTIQNLIENSISVANLPKLEAQIGNKDYEERRQKQIQPQFHIPKISAPCYLEELKMLQLQQQQQKEQKQQQIDEQQKHTLKVPQLHNFKYESFSYCRQPNDIISKSFVTKKAQAYEKLTMTPLTLKLQQQQQPERSASTSNSMQNKIKDLQSNKTDNFNSNNGENKTLSTTFETISNKTSNNITNCTTSNNNQINENVLQENIAIKKSDQQQQINGNLNEIQNEKHYNSRRISNRKLSENKKKLSSGSILEDVDMFGKKSTASILQYEDKQTQEFSRKEGLIFKRPELSNTKEKIKISTHQKDEKTSKLIMRAIENNDFLNNYMDDERKKRVIDAMEPAIYDKGKFIIREGEEGSEIYVSEEGVFEVIKNNEIINTLGAGIVFGELAILYNAKRFASIRAATKTKVWKIDRSKFRTIMLISGSKENEENLAFLKTSPLNKDLSEEVLKKVTDLLVRRFFPTNTCILRQGDYGDDFYIIRGGSVTVKKTNESGEERKVNRLKRGDYFGEQALLNTDVRQASVYADAPGTECLKLDRVNFISYLGTIKELKEKPIDRDIVPEENPTKLVSPYDYVELKDLKKITTLGAGAFGRVDLVTYKHDKSFALKIIKKIDIIKQGQIDHIYNEKLVMSMCHQSPFIVELYKTYRDTKYVYFLMESCLGGDVWTLMYQRKSFDERTVRFISGCVIEAFNFLHTRNIIYRDLKPENLMLTTEGYCKLVDFGFAKRLSRNYKTNTFAGTPEYVAPEIILDRGHDRAVDYWALGILIYELLVGRTPFRGQNQMKIYQHILGGIESIKMPSRIPRTAQSLIKNLCRQLPAERLGYQRKGIADIKKHGWYDGFDWDKLLNQTMSSPIKRPINSITDTQYFPTTFEIDNDVPPDDFSGWDANF